MLPVSTLKLDYAENHCFGPCLQTGRLCVHCDHSKVASLCLQFYFPNQLLLDDTQNSYTIAFETNKKPLIVFVYV